jgi:ATP-dependent Lhr-like helicase
MTPPATVATTSCSRSDSDDRSTPVPSATSTPVTQPSELNPAQAFERLHTDVKRWVWDQQWTTLRSVQAHAIGPILDNRDVLVSAATAAGKTEAAWLPVASAIATLEADRPSGVNALYVGPLKALINDQYLRLESLGERTSIPIHRWHGDVPASAKKKVRGKPDGILLITPESLEALFVREGPRVPAIFNGLMHIVIDEFHSFIGTERGAQLQSLMHRIDLAVRRRVPRIGLSATLADLGDAAEYLRPGRGDHVALVVPPTYEGTEIQLQVRGYLRRSPDAKKSNAAQTNQDNDAAQTDYPEDALAIGAHLFKTLRGRDNLVFANSRTYVEAYTDILTRMSEDQRVPNEFVAHHGNLSKEHREDVEARLKSTERPTTAICTSTLEMGIDIGSTDSVAQVGAPPTVAALRQRLGRSGRRDQPATLRAYISEQEITDRTPPADMLRAQLFQTVAMTELMLNDRWYEPPPLDDLHLSTLTQQILSVIAQHGGATASELHSALSGQGPFSAVDSDMFLRLLRCLGDAEILTQSSDGTLLAGIVGDHIVNHYSFYSAFQSSDEYRLIAHGRTLGTIPVDYPVLVGSYLIFAGMRWQVLSVDTSARTIELTRASGGRPPAFAGSGAEVADEVRRRMKALYRSIEVPMYLDSAARTLLQQGRTSFRQLQLADRMILDWGRDTVILPWRGDIILSTLVVALTTRDLRVAKDGAGLTVVGASPAEVIQAAHDLVSQGEPDPAELAASVTIKARDKYDEYLSEDLLNIAYAARSLSIPDAWATLDALAHDHGADSGPRNHHPASPPSTTAQLGVTPFAVVDVETTGFTPMGEDRVIEVAVVHTDAQGRTTSSWSTLVNPGRDPGPTHVHGVAAEDLTGAPTWADIADWVASLLAGRIVVAHNAGFETAFLTVEYERANLEVPSWPTLDTLEAAVALGSDARNLHAVCSEYGIDAIHAHTALGDATATAHLLAAVLTQATLTGTDLHKLVSGHELHPSRATQPVAPPASPRVSSRRTDPQTSQLMSVLGSAHPATQDPSTNAYLAVLDAGLLKYPAGLTVGSLFAESARLGLTEEAAASVTADYLRALTGRIEGQTLLAAERLLRSLDDARKHSP